MRPAAARTLPYPLFGRAELLVALFGSAVMALAGAGAANWFGHPAGAASAPERSAFAEWSR